METEGPLVGAIDQGTSSSRFLVFAANTGQLIASHQIEVERLCPKEGWVEQDATDLLDTTLTCIDKVIEDGKVSPSSIKAIGITNQRETIVVWDKLTGKPLHNALVWLDMRTSKQVEEILSTEPEMAEKIRTLCGLPMSTYFSALKMQWLLQNVASVQEAVIQDRCLLGTVDSWLVWNLTGGVNGGLHLTDVTNASRTMLMNIRTMEWDAELCEYFKIPAKVLPVIRSSSEIYGHMSTTLLKGVPISGILGDQQAALLGQSCFSPGQAKCTYGTGCFLLFNTGDKPVKSRYGLLTTVGYKMGPKSPVVYALEGSVAVAGLAIRWLRDNLGFGQTYPEIVALAESVQDSAGVYLVPAFSGLFAPYWRPDARGVICGMTEFTTKAHIARAAYEGVAFQVKDILEAMNAEVTDIGLDGVSLLQVDGGMTVVNMLLQMQADCVGIDTIRPKMLETSALGAAMAAGNAEDVNVWNLNQPQDNKISGRDVFRPTTSVEERRVQYDKWKDAVGRSVKSTGITQL